MFKVQKCCVEILTIYYDLIQTNEKDEEISRIILFVEPKQTTKTKVIEQYSIEEAKTYFPDYSSAIDDLIEIFKKKEEE